MGSIFMNTEVAEKKIFLDPEITTMERFLDPKIVDMDKKSYIAFLYLSL